MKVLLINNIFTPYRTFLFDEIETMSKDLGIEFSVFYQFEKEAERHWDIDPKSFNHKFKLSNKFISLKREYYSFLSINFDLLKIDFNKFDYVIFSPLMSVNNLLLSKVVPMEKQVHWIESNLDSTKSVKGIKSVIKKMALNRASKFLIPGEKAKEYIELFNSNTSNEYINFPNLIDFDSYYNARGFFSDKEKDLIKESLGIAPDKKIFLVVGEVSERKGSDRLLDILKNVCGEYVIIVLGTGSLFDELSNQALNNFKNRLFFLGQAEQSDVLRYFSISDFFLHLARRDPSPLVCVEAITAGLVMAVSMQTGNSPEVIDNNGVSFDVDDDDELFKSIKSLLALNQDEICNLQYKSRLIAEQKFSPEAVIGTTFRSLKKS